MAKIPLSSGTFTVIPEGHYIFKVTKVEYKETFGKLAVTLETQDGQKTIERYSFLKSDGSEQQGAINAFSYFAKAAMGDFSLEEIDHEDILGHFIEADVTHTVQPNKNDPSKMVTFVNLSNTQPSNGWDETAQPVAQTPATTPAPAPAAPAQPAATPGITYGADGKPVVDLAAILG